MDHHQGNEMNMEQVLSRYLAGEDYWAAELIHALDIERFGAAFEWAHSSIAGVLQWEGGNRVDEQSILDSALTCTQPDLLRHYSGQIEEIQQDLLSLAIANLITARVFDLLKKPKRMRFFLNCVMMHLRRYCQSRDIPSNVLFHVLPPNSLQGDPGLN